MESSNNSQRSVPFQNTIDRPKPGTVSTTLKRQRNSQRRAADARGAPADDELFDGALDGASAIQAELRTVEASSGEAQMEIALDDGLLARPASSRATHATTHARDFPPRQLSLSRLAFLKPPFLRRGGVDIFAPPPKVQLPRSMPSPTRGASFRIADFSVSLSKKEPRRRFCFD